MTKAERNLLLVMCRGLLALLRKEGGPGYSLGVTSDLEDAMEALTEETKAHELPLVPCDVQPTTGENL